MKQVNLPDIVAVHPTVLLSVVDHYNRVGKDLRRRVVGVLLGKIVWIIVRNFNSILKNFIILISWRAYIFRGI